ncbi:MAG: LicD family protein [Clostridiales bacterium]|nr:LicD family protein [Clostridiales bacterium]
MRPVPANEYQHILLGILKAFSGYCAENGVKLLLCGGTALGAVRHGGFIPWDDDIDLYIDREGFEKLTGLAGEDPYIDGEKRYKIMLPAVFPSVNPFFNVVDCSTVAYQKNVSKKYAAGIWIDVFCLSFWADNEKEARRQYRLNRFYRNMNKIIIGGNYRDRKYRILEAFAFPVRGLLLLLGMNSEYWCRKMMALDRYRSGEYVGNICWPDGFEKERYRAEWFAEDEDILFEDLHCRIAKGYDSILKNFYGDYMTPPPEDKRVRHDPEAFYLD